MRVLIIVVLFPLVYLVGIELLKNRTSAAVLYAILSVLITPTLMTS